MYKKLNVIVRVILLKLKEGRIQEEVIEYYR